MPSFRRSRVAEMSSPGVLRIAVDSTPIDVANLLAVVSDAGVGAVSLFLGTVRDLNDGRPVTGIEYEAYQPMAELELRAIAQDVCDATPGLRIAIEHRVGTLLVGDISVAIAAAHAHRAEALDATRTVIDTLKKRVPIWKQEHYVDGERAWVDPTATARQRGVPQ